MAFQVPGLQLLLPVHHPPSVLPPSRSVLGLVVLVVAPALVVALVPAVVAMVLALVTCQHGTSICIAHLACELEVFSSSCSATVLLLQVNSHLVQGA